MLDFKICFDHSFSLFFYFQLVEIDENCLVKISTIALPSDMLLPQICKGIYSACFFVIM